MNDYTHVTHTFCPVFDKDSRILILGSFPSVKSREQNFYYGHPQNRFWKVLASLFDNNEIISTIVDKRSFLLKCNIAVWDVIESCDIVGSSDSSIKNVIPNDMNIILNNAPIKAIFANGDKAYRLYMKYCQAATTIPIVKLPSTSPANAACSLDKLIKIWRELIFPLYYS